MKEVQAIVSSQQLTTTGSVLANLNISKRRRAPFYNQQFATPYEKTKELKSNTTYSQNPIKHNPFTTLWLDHRSLLINVLINYLMQSWTCFPCFVILNHTLQAVTEVIIGSFKIFLGQPLSSIVLQKVGGVSTTLCAPSACAHSGEGQRSSN